MPWEAWVTLIAVTFMVGGLAWNWPADLLVIGVMTFLVLLGEITGTPNLPSAKAAVAEFGNTGLMTVGALFVVVAGLISTGALNIVTDPIVGRPKSVLAAQIRILLPTATLSAFINNTPLVAMFLPIVQDVCKKTGISPSKLYMPLAFGATLGGVCTLIGTSTNLVVHGLMESAKIPTLALLDLAWVGVPVAVAGSIYMLIASRFLLPDRKPPISLSDDPRQYTIEMVVNPDGPLVGRSIEAAGLRHLPGLYLAEIDREGEVLAAVGPREKMRAGDRLVFVGILNSVVDLRRIRGLSPATDQVFKLGGPTAQRCLVEAVVSHRCPLVGGSIREGRFRSTYDAAVIAVARGGRRLDEKIGDVVLQSGDTLLLEAQPDFVERQQNSNNFYLVSRVEDSAPPRHEKAWMALAILFGLIVLGSTEVLDMVTVSLAAAMMMIATGCCSGAEARRNVDWSLLSVIGASLAIGRALESSGLAAIISKYLIEAAQGSPWGVLAAVYLVTLILTEIVTNNAAAVLVFPLAVSAANGMGASTTPFMVTIMVAASCGFATPFGYQTNLMVYGPGGYRFSDYLRFGIPLDIIAMIVTVALVPFIWPFY